MEGSEYHAKWSKSEGKEQEQKYDFSDIWDIKEKATQEQTSFTGTDARMVVTRGGGREWGEDTEVKGV